MPAALGPESLPVPDELGATALALSIPRHQIVPADQGYSAAAIVSTAVLVAAFASSAPFTVTTRKSSHQAAGIDA